MRWVAVVLLAVGSFCTSATAESPNAAAPPCPPGAAIKQSHLLGLWRATFEGVAQGATLLLERHPEFSESVRGTVHRGAEKAQVAGDVDEGEFTLEESVDGVRISATWTGAVVDGSCGREIRGDWKGTADPKSRPFVLRKVTPGW